MQVFDEKKLNIIFFMPLFSGIALLRYQTVHRAKCAGWTEKRQLIRLWFTLDHCFSGLALLVAKRRNSCVSTS